MTKKTTTLTIDDELIECAKKNFLNISEIAEKALREKLERLTIEIHKSIDCCEFCGKQIEKATNKNLNGLSWLYPDEKWICPTCLYHKVSEIIKI